MCLLGCDLVTRGDLWFKADRAWSQAVELRVEFPVLLTADSDSTLGTNAITTFLHLVVFEVDLLLSTFLNGPSSPLHIFWKYPRSSRATSSQFDAIPWIGKSAGPPMDPQIGGFSTHGVDGISPKAPCHTRCGEWHALCGPRQPRNDTPGRLHRHQQKDCGAVKDYLHIGIFYYTYLYIYVYIYTSDYICMCIHI